MRILHASRFLTLEAFPVVDRDGADHEFLRLRMPDWVAVVAVTPDGAFVLVEQHRHGSGRAGLEPVGGVVDPGESPEACARRELREEVGHTAAAYVSLGVVFPNPALQTNRCHLFLATGARPSVPPAPDPTESLRTVVLRRAEVERRLANDGFDAALGVLAVERALRHPLTGGRHFG